MRHRGRLGLLAISVVLLGCSSGNPTAPPTAAASPTAAIETPSVTQPILTSPTVTPEPAFSCPPGGGPGEASFTVHTLGGGAGVDLVPSPEAAPTLPPAPVSSSDPGATIDPTDEEGIESVLGGAQTRAGLSVDMVDDDVATISSLVADFVPRGASAALPVKVTIDGSGASLRLPDGNATGVLRVAIGWTTLCGSGAGTGEVALKVLDSSIAAGCPAAQDDLLAAVVALQDVEVQVGTLAVPLGIYGWSGRWIVANGVTDFGTLFPGWDPKKAVVAAPGGSIVVRESVDDLHLQSMRIGIYLRADVEAYLKPGSDQEISVVDVVRRSPGPLGRLGIPAPLDPGSYVFDLEGSWQTRCLQLDTTAAVSVEVR